MQDKEVLGFLQSMLDNLETVARRYRSDRNVSKALKNVYSSVAIAGGAIIQKMTDDETEAMNKAKADAKAKFRADAIERRKKKNA